MNPTPLASLVPIVPELILALGAMALLMLGAYRQNSTSIVNFGAVVLLIAAAFARGKASAGAITAYCQSPSNAYVSASPLYACA